MKFLIKFFCLTFLISPLFATQSVDQLLQEIENNSDLSEKTKLQNSGIVTVYTRKDLERMQVKELKDILKSAEFFGYTENRFGISDPLTTGNAVPSMSSLIKLYIDDQEITSGIYGSGISILGDIGLDFVDHIEIYTQSTTYEYSIEPSLMLIKIYSKTAYKDDGSKLSAYLDNYGTRHLNLYNIGDIDREWSYMAYSSFENTQRENYYDLSRDAKKFQAFFTLKSEQQNLQLLVTKRELDAFIGMSIDATPEDNDLDGESLHLGYSAQLNNFSFLLSYEYLTRDYYFTDDTPPITMIDNSIESQVMTAKLQYKKKFEKHQLMIGIKNRFKYYDTTKNIKNGEEVPTKLNKAQTVSSLYMEEQYFPYANLILTGGMEFLKVENINAIKNEESFPFLYRYGVTYLKNHFTFKIIGSYTESYLEPYLIDSSIVADGAVENFKTNVLFSQLSYAYQNTKVDFLLGRIATKNYLYPDQDNGGKLTAYSDIVIAKSVMTKVKYKYNEFNQFSLKLLFTYMENFPVVDKENYYKVVLSNLQTYNKYDLFEELVYDRDSQTKKNSYDLSLGVRYHANRDFTLSLKGENLLHRAKETEYLLRDPETFTSNGTLDVQAIDRRVLVTVEYLF